MKVDVTIYVILYVNNTSASYTGRPRPYFRVYILKYKGISCSSCLLYEVVKTVVKTAMTIKLPEKHVFPLKQLPLALYSRNTSI